MVPFLIFYMAEGQGFEPWVGYKPTPVFKTGALNHSATLPCGANYTWVFNISNTQTEKNRLSRLFF